VSRKPLVVELPRPIATEIADVVARTQRSPAFVALRALGAAPAAPAAPPAGDRAALALTTDDDDPPNTAAKLKAAAAGRPLDEALAAAWVATRARFQRWAEREVALRGAERADDLDAGLAAAADPATPPGRLAELAASPYPRIRALVAAHPQAPADALARLAEDREPYVRDAVRDRGAR
jgi:hypothetical protein